MGDYELYHAERKHKYIKKIGKRYFYTQQEIAAYLKAKRGDVTFEKGTVDDYTEYNSKTKKSPTMKDYHLDFNKEKGTYTYRDSKGKTHTENYTWSDKIGVRVGNKKVQFYNTKNQKYYKDGERVTNQRRGRFTREYAEDGSNYTLDLSDKKTHKKRAAAADKRYKGWYESRKENGWVDKDESKYIEKELANRDKQRKRGSAKKTVSKNANKALSSLKKHAAKGKKAVDKLYTKLTTPDITVTYDEAKIK